MVLFFTPKKSGPIDKEYETKRAACKRYRDAIRNHTTALKDLSEAISVCMRSLEAVAASLCSLAADTDQPGAISVTAALQRGLSDIRDRRELDDLQEEAEHSLSMRFKGLDSEYTALEESRKRRSKMLKQLDTIRADCEKLERKNEGGAKEQNRLQAQEVEFRRFDSEFNDSFNDFMQHLGSAVYDDVRELSFSIHAVLSLFSYQFRKCHENLTQKRVSGSSAVSPSEGLTFSETTTGTAATRV